jgi:hypothetical protein
MEDGAAVNRIAGLAKVKEVTAGIIAGGVASCALILWWFLVVVPEKYYRARVFFLMTNLSGDLSLELIVMAASLVLATGMLILQRRLNRKALIGAFLCCCGNTVALFAWMWPRWLPEIGPIGLRWLCGMGIGMAVVMWTAVGRRVE